MWSHAMTGKECLLVAVTMMIGMEARADADLQYASGDIAIPAATADEPIREKFSLEAAVDYLERGATAWQDARKCVSCHTNGVYNQFRPAMSPILGKPNPANRAFLVSETAESRTLDAEVLKKGLRPTQAAVTAHGLAEWDRHVNDRLSDETRDALAFMLELQRDDGSWGNDTCWPPFESSNYHGATVAALAIGTAPGYLDELDPEKRAAVERLKTFLKEHEAPHDYGRLLLLWASTRLDGLIDETKRETLVNMVLGHQNEDGGWSIRTFSTPEAWGDGRRAEKLRTETEFELRPSDGHQTGLAILVLREAGLPPEHPALQAGIAWLKSNQRASGRWWTRSLNTDKQHFITYSGTMYPLAALQLCGELE